MKTYYYENIKEYNTTLKNIESLKNKGMITDFEAIDLVKRTSCELIIKLSKEAKKLEKRYDNLKNKDNLNAALYMLDIENISNYINNDLHHFAPYTHLYM